MAEFSEFVDLETWIIFKGAPPGSNHGQTVTDGDFLSHVKPPWIDKRDGKQWPPGELVYQEIRIYLMNH